MVVYPRVSAQVLGEGKFGIVRRGLLMPASLPVAVKTILKNQGGDAALFEARDEVEMMHEDWCEESPEDVACLMWLEHLKGKREGL